MIIPETRWTHAIILRVGNAGASLVILSDRKIYTIIVARWPWSAPIELTDLNGVQTKTRFLFLDFRSRPLNLEQVVVNGKTCEDFLPDAA